MDTTTCLHDGTVAHACGHEFEVTVEDGMVIQMDLPPADPTYRARRCVCGTVITDDAVLDALESCTDPHGREE